MTDALTDAFAPSNPAARLPVIRWLPWLACSLVLVGLLAFAVYWPSANGLDARGDQIGRDFINVWAGPQLAFSGRLATLFDLKAYTAAIGVLFGQPLQFHNWSYPLFVLPAFWPLAQLPYFWALAVWTAVLFAVFAAVTLSQVARPRRGFALLALCAAPAGLVNILNGQNGFLSAALLLGGALWIDRRPIAAGVLFGLLTFKPQIGIVLPFVLVALGAWRVMASACVTAAVLLAGSVLLFGVDAWRQYLDVSAAHQVLLLRDFGGFYTLMMTSVLAGARLSGLPYGAALGLQLAVALPVLALSCWAVRKTADPCRRAFVLAAAAPLITPYAFNYDLTAMAAVLVWILCGRLPWRSGWALLYLLAWTAPAAMMFLNLYGLGLAPLLLIALFGLSVREALANPAASGDVGRPLPAAA